MPERAVDIPEKVLSEDYWSGHSPQDSCDWRLPRYLTEKQPSYIAVLRDDFKMDDFFWDNIWDFQEQADGTKVRIFHLGETFSVHNFPPGTVVRFESESLYRPKNEDWGYLKEVFIGVICVSELRRQRIIIHVPELILDENPDTHELLSSEIIVGKVEHWRFWDKKHKALYQDILRCNWLEVLQYGKGLSEDSTKVVVPQGEFIPQGA